MSKAKFYELKRTKDLEELESEVNKELKAEGKGKLAVRLFQTEQGEVGYSIRVIPTGSGRKDLDIVHRVACRVLGYKRGRPRGVPTRQVKVRVPEETYQKLVRQAKRRHVAPSRLAGELLIEKVGA
jgi:hypothetical protein